MSGASLLVAGLGDVGMRLARRRLALGDEVIGVRRHPVEHDGGPRVIRADLATGGRLSRLPRRVEAIVFCPAPDQRDETAYRALYHDGLRRLMDRCDAQRLVFVSSTAVYAQDAGEWVDEDTPAEAQAFNGRVLRQSEQALDVRPGGIALRLSGLYGPGREMMLRKAREGAAGSARWTNRLHVDDAAGALSHLLDLREPMACYLGNDDLPAQEHEVLDWIRVREGLPSVPPVTGPSTGRRVGNARLRDSGWAPAFPDYREGYGPLLQTPSP